MTEKTLTATVGHPTAYKIKSWIPVATGMTIYKVNVGWALPTITFTA